MERGVGSGSVSRLGYRKDNRGKRVLEKILHRADVQIGGNRPWDIQVRNPAFYDRILTGGSLALGESYMEGWWDCEALDRFFDKVLSARLDKTVKKSMDLLWAIIRRKLMNPQHSSRAFEIGKRHYDIGNDLFCVMLDKEMNYSCGYWHKATTLEEAQKDKLDLICRKIGLEPGMKVLDIGCGWGGFAKYAAEITGIDVLGITVSKEQVKFAREHCKGFPVRIELMDYRALDETFDRIVCVGMFEHVGEKNYRSFMTVVHQCLEPDGLFLLHTIGGNNSTFKTDPWIGKYIFPNSMLPSAKQITIAAEGLFVLEDWHSFGHCYDKTLMAWNQNFTENWSQIKKAYDERFYRMWSYYLLSCAGSFRARRNQLWQIVFSKKGLRKSYTRTI
ncbi:MAG: cyclopropane fatty acyl phospholipid synthase [Deltaproteobacteria bacterium]|nr:cyclopropane fatty acyl phospholipid synthase [Deltaproteobacteria bacterium]